MYHSYMRMALRSPWPMRRTVYWDWLGMQPSESVIYVSFGSGGTLSAKQTNELAWGLELSRQNFVWVIRPPMDDDAAAALFTSADDVMASQSTCLMGSWSGPKSAEKALSKGGSSYTSLSHVVMDCQMMSRSSQQPLDNRTSTNPPSPSLKGMHLTTVVAKVPYKGLLDYPNDKGIALLHASHGVLCYYLKSYISACLYMRYQTT
ncbi:UDP-glycosyltransferase 72C1 [Vitis vinifera]|uniref:UDP-glycosyltransferase 72C1 n=1 Tax=Vitis vinifera TaxID=29760 RepID=A0A438GP27_VITVI|nr:UDP-glycosyltransferase 72C1 [Vitis vinifera]